MSHSLFNGFITFIILANTIVLASDHNNSSDTYNQVTEGLNFFFFGVFVLEMVLKLIGYGFSQYFKDKYNTFDCIVVILSIVDLVITQSKIFVLSGANSL